MVTAASSVPRSVLVNDTSRAAGLRCGSGGPARSASSATTRSGSPTPVPGKKTVVLARYATNRRLGDALHLQASSALVASPGARAYYDALRARKIGHHAALRQLANRLVGILHGCLKTGTKYDEKTAWQHQIVAAA